jgi:hypothetical protein
VEGGGGGLAVSGVSRNRGGFVKCVTIQKGLGIPVVDIDINYDISLLKFFKWTSEYTYELYVHTAILIHTCMCTCTHTFWNMSPSFVVSCYEIELWGDWKWSDL